MSRRPGFPKRVIAVALAAFVVGGAVGGLVARQLDERQRMSVPSTTIPPPIASTPEDAILRYLAAHGHSYIGTCAKTSIPADIGRYCSILRQDNGVTRNYLVGPVASEGDIFVVARRSQGWQVVFVSSTPPLVP